MSAHPYAQWAGDWHGRPDDGQARHTLVRVGLELILHGEVMRMQLERISADRPELVEAAAALIGVGPDGVLRCGLWSSSDGACVLEQTPDDPDVLAVSGVQPCGKHHTLSIVDDGPGRLRLTWIRREPEGKAPETRLSVAVAPLLPKGPVRA